MKPETHGPPLNKYTHEDPERHFIGESLPVPGAVTSTGTATVGTSPIPAREDHSHNSALGIVAWKFISGSIVAPTTGVTFVIIDVVLTAGRMYEFTFTARALGPSAAGIAGNVVHLCSPSCPIFGLDVHSFVSGNYDNFNWSTLMAPTVTQNYNITVKASTVSGTLTFHFNDQAGLWIKDIGPVIAMS